MENFRKIRRPRPSLRRAWDHRGVELGCFVAWRSSVPFIFLALKTFQNHPKPSKTSKGFFGTRRPTHQGHIEHFFLGLQGAINIFLLRSSLPFARLQTLQNLTKPPQTPQNPPKALLARLTPQANAPRPHQQLLLGLQGAITNFLLAFKPAVCQASNPSIPSKTPQNPQELTKTLQRLF